MGLVLSFLGESRKIYPYSFSSTFKSILFFLFFFIFHLIGTDLPCIWHEAREGKLLDEEFTSLLLLLSVDQIIPLQQPD